MLQGFAKQAAKAAIRYAPTYLQNEFKTMCYGGLACYCLAVCWGAWRHPDTSIFIAVAQLALGLGIGYYVAQQVEATIGYCVRHPAICDDAAAAPSGGAIGAATPPPAAPFDTETVSRLAGPRADIVGSSDRSLLAGRRVLVESSSSSDDELD